MKRHHGIAMILALSVLLGGCSSLSLNATDILSPPRAAGERAEIQKLIEAGAGDDYELLYPDGGEYKSAVTFRDMNGDGEDDAIALYASADGTARVLFARKDGDSYVTAGERDLPSSSVRSLSFADITADGRHELLISSASAGAATLSMYHIDDAITEVNIAEGYEEYLCGDFDGNGADDVLLLMMKSAESAAHARLMVYSDAAFSEKSRCEIDSSVAEYPSLRFGNISDTIQGAVLDGTLPTGEYATQVLFYDAAQHSLLNPVYISPMYRDTVRSAAVSSADTDGDDIIEIPVCSAMDYTADEDPSRVCTRVQWSSYDFSTMSLVTKNTSILCDKLDFMLNLDDRHVGCVTARYSGNNAVTVYAWEYKDDVPRRTTALLTIRYYDKQDYDSSRVIEAALYENNTGIYTYTIDSTSSYISYTDDEVQENFSIINQSSIK